MNIEPRIKKIKLTDENMAEVNAQDEKALNKFSRQNAALGKAHAHCCSLGVHVWCYKFLLLLFVKKNRCRDHSEA